MIGTVELLAGEHADAGGSRAGKRWRPGTFREDDMQEIKETPERMVVDGRVAEYGKFKQPFREVNLLDAEIEIGGRPAPRFLKELRLKEWEHFGIIHDEYYFGMVIFDAKYMGTSFFYAFNRKTGEFFEHSRTGVGNPIRVARELWHGECLFSHIGYSMEFENRLDAGFHRMKAEIRASRKKPSVKAEIRMLEQLARFEPLVVVSPIAGNRALYTHKNACPVEGLVEIGGKAVELDPGRHVALMDVQKTYYPFNTFWKWSTFGGYDEGGRLLAMNVCQNFIEDDERYNENCTWVDGNITPLPAARFDFDESDLLAGWKLRTTGGELDVEFTPAGERVGKISLGVIMSDFHQPFGQFKGTMSGPGGVSLDVNGQFGLCEHHLARF
jgi:hypothetical protein